MKRWKDIKKKTSASVVCTLLKEDPKGCYSALIILCALFLMTSAKLQFYSKNILYGKVLATCFALLRIAITAVKIKK